MNVLLYAIRRTASAIPVVLGVSALVFFLIHLVPGDPARTMLGFRATDRAVATLHHEWGLDQPLPLQYLLFLRRLSHGDLGLSLFYGTPVTDLIRERLGATAWLLLYSLTLATILTVLLAIVAASKKDALRDQIIRAVPMVGLGMPAFWLGIMLILLFALKLQWFPVGGYGSGILGHIHALFLPSLTIALGMTPILVRSLRASILEVLAADYILFARAKGLTRLRILTHHVLRTAFVSTLGVFAVNVGYVIGSTVVVEKVFAVPGTGSLMLEAVLARDFPVVQGLTLLYGLAVVFVYLLTDMLYLVLDPRISFN